MVIGSIVVVTSNVQQLLIQDTEGLPFKNSFDFILTPTPHMLGIGRKLLISRVQKTQHAK
jgi:hypothetical protein